MDTHEAEYALSKEHVPMRPLSSQPLQDLSYPAEPGSSKMSQSYGQHGGSSRVDCDFFDPEGVHELERKMSQEERSNQVEDRRRVSIASSDSGTVVGSLSIDPPSSFNLGKTFREIIKRTDNSGIKRRELGVSFKDLRVVGLGATATYQQTFGSALNPLNLIDNIRQFLHPPTRDILHGFEGVVKPGEMLLVLGRPGAGCSTLLRVLANQRSDFHSVEGEVHYDSFSPEEIYKHYRGDVQYCPEDDIHFPSLTVEQTIKFAARMRTPHNRIDAMSRERHIALCTDVVTTVFGLRHVRQTLVGDASIRGVSGGEKKRVSISEALVARSLINSWDNSTRGLDASTALEFVQALRIATDVARMSTIVSIYQAGESLYNLFDKVCVVYEGEMAYFGPANRARQYFIDMGYEPAYRQTTADFLVSVTDPNGRIIRPGFESRIPRTAVEFAQYFKSSEIGRLNVEDIDSYNCAFTGKAERLNEYVMSSHAEHVRCASKKSSFIISIPMQVRALMVRRLQIIRGSYMSQAIQLFTFIVQGVIVGSVFLKLSDATATYFSRGGVLFFALLFAAFSAMAEIPTLFAQRPIVERQSKAAQYYSFVEALAMMLVDIPITFITLLIFSVILYFLTGLQRSAGQFFIFLLLVFAMTLTMKSWFRMVSAAFKSAAPAQAIAGFTILMLVLYTGYTLPIPSMVGGLRWVSYLNPLRYGFEAVVMNEFHTLNGVCSTLVPSGPGYENVSLANQVCTAVGSVPGQPTVDGDTFALLSFGYLYSHLWRNFGIICVFCITFMLGILVFTEINNGSVGESSATLFKRGSQPAVAIDELKAISDEESVDASAGRDPARDAGHVTVETDVPHTAFSWHDLRYTVPVGSGNQRLLLDNVSGYVEPGKLTALMGESGAGKTTLLNVLAERQGSGVVEGERLINGKPLPPMFQSQTGYCQQMDTHLGTATVREALLFSAVLRQPASVPLAEKQAYVEKCLDICGLHSYADAIVESLGVEHRKRTTIGVELVAKPSLIFLDEPTSGLDSQSAWAIISFLRKLADSGQSIVCTIHQPSAELFQVFDRLLLLRKGGQTVYFGDLGERSSTLLGYFEKHGSRPCRNDENPAEFILDVIGAGATASSAADWHDAWQHSEEASTLRKQLDQMRSLREPHAVNEGPRSTYHTSWIFQMLTLLYRNAQYHWRNPTYILAKIGLNIAAGLFIGFTYYKAKLSIQGTQNHVFAIFMTTLVSVPLANQLQVMFIDVRTVYEIRERYSRMYHWSALVTSQLLIELPWNILASSLFFFCWYWTLGLSQERAGYTFLLYSVLFPLYYTSLGQAVAAMAPDANIAALLFSFFAVFPLTMCGVLQPFRELGWWQWMYRVSPFTYLIEGLVGQAIGRLEITCAVEELVPVNPPAGQSCEQYMGPFIALNGGYLTNPDASAACAFCQYRTTDAFLENSFNISYSHHWRDLAIYCVFVGFNIFALYALTYIFRIRQGSVAPAWLQRALSKRKSS